uniref:BTB domain-containing protein n=1 Tax=Strongyloides stercoralis TaxID=6248 RepID=A0A0K0E321_STRER
MNQVTFGKGNKFIPTSPIHDNKNSNQNIKLYYLYKEYLQSNEKCDLTIILNKKFVEKVHSTVFFCFATNLIQPINKKIEICNDNITEKILKYMIKYMYTGQIIISQNEFAMFYYLTKHFGVKKLKIAAESYISKMKEESYKKKSSKKMKNQFNRQSLSSSKSTSSKITDTLPTSEYINQQSYVSHPKKDNFQIKFSNSTNNQNSYQNNVLPLIATKNYSSNNDKIYEKSTKSTKSRKNKSSKRRQSNKAPKNQDFCSKNISQVRYKGG